MSEQDRQPEVVKAPSKPVRGVDYFIDEDAGDEMPYDPEAHIVRGYN